MVVVFGLGVIYGNHMNSYARGRATTQTRINWMTHDLLHEIMMDNTTYWQDSVMTSPEYKALDSIKGGDWEDFYYDAIARQELMFGW